MNNYLKRALIATGIAAVLGIFCVIGQAQRTPSSVLPNPTVYLFSAWFHRVLMGIAIGLGSYLIAYQKVLKYPPPVRKIRKFKKNIKNIKNLEKIDVESREASFSLVYNEYLGNLKKKIKAERGSGIKKDPNITKKKQKGGVPK